MAVKNNPTSDRETKNELSLLQGYFDQEFDSEFLMTQLETEADRATRAIQQISNHTPPKGPLGRFFHRLSHLIFGS